MHDDAVKPVDSVGAGGDAPLVGSFDEFSAARGSTLVRAVTLILADRRRGIAATEEALRRVARRWDRLGGRDPAIRLIRTALRRGRRNAGATVEQDVFGAEPGESAAERAIDQALTEMPVDQRAVLVLTYYLEWSHEDIGHALRLPARTVARRLDAALGSIEKAAEMDTPPERISRRLRVAAERLDVASLADRAAVAPGAASRPPPLAIAAGLVALIVAVGVIADRAGAPGDRSTDVTLPPGDVFAGVPSTSPATLPIPPRPTGEPPSSTAWQVISAEGQHAFEIDGTLAIYDSAPERLGLRRTTLADDLSPTGRGEVVIDDPVWVTDVVAGGPGLVAIGYAPSEPLTQQMLFGTPSLWSSRDGTVWRHHDYPAGIVPIGSLAVAAAPGAGVVIVERAGTDPEWVSDVIDGLPSEARSLVEQFEFIPPTGSTGDRIEIRGPLGVVLYRGTLGDLGIEATSSIRPARTRHSFDLDSWTDVDVGEYESVEPVAAAGNEFLLQAWEPARSVGWFLSSPDGLTWTRRRATRSGLHVLGLTAAGYVARTDEGIVASEDLEDWRALSLFRRADGPVDATSDGIAVVGIVRDDAVPFDNAIRLASGDDLIVIDMRSFQVTVLADGAPPVRAALGDALYDPASDRLVLTDDGSPVASVSRARFQQAVEVWEEQAGRAQEEAVSEFLVVSRDGQVASVLGGPLDAGGGGVISDVRLTSGHVIVFVTGVDGAAVYVTPLPSL